MVEKIGRTEMKRLGLTLALAAGLGAAGAAQNQQGVCMPALFSGTGSSSCLRGVYLATSIWAGDCESGCPFILNLRYEVKASCGGGWGGDRVVDFLPCGGIAEFDYTYGDDTIAWANFTCFFCEPGDPSTVEVIEEEHYSGN